MGQAYATKVYAVLRPFAVVADGASKEGAPPCPSGTLIDVKLTSAAAKEVQKNHPGSVVVKRFATK